MNGPSVPAAGTANLQVTGRAACRNRTDEAIAAGISTFRQRFANRAVVTIENEAAPPPRHRRHGQHRA
jgi:hypothetical protein